MGRCLVFTGSFAVLVSLADAEDKMTCTLDDFKVGGELFVANHMAFVWELPKLAGLAQKPVSSAALQSEVYFFRRIFVFWEKRNLICSSWQWSSIKKKIYEIQFTLVKCTIQWFLVQSQSCGTVITSVSFRKYLSPPSCSLVLLFPSPHPAPSNHLSAFCLNGFTYSGYFILVEVVLCGFFLIKFY